jgi:hypothetical protein
MFVIATLAFVAVTINRGSTPDKIVGDANARNQAAMGLVIDMDAKMRIAKLIESRKLAIIAMMDGADRHLSPGSATPAEVKVEKSRALDAWQEEMNSERIIQGIAEIYAQLFTLDELRELSGFYRTSAGRALVANGAEVQRKTGALINQRSRSATAVVLKMQDAFRRAHSGPATPPEGFVQGKNATADAAVKGP